MAEALFRRALVRALEDPRAAAIDYARAALLGHARAAYYLGQIYETGDGVPVDFVIARHWYGTASAALSGAERRLADLPMPQGGTLAPPLPLFAERTDGGDADFVWASGPGADPASFEIELSADPGDPAAVILQVSGSAARLPVAPRTSHWRVLALSASGQRSAASDWHAIARAAPTLAAGEE